MRRVGPDSGKVTDDRFHRSEAEDEYRALTCTGIFVHAEKKATPQKRDALCYKAKNTRRMITIRLHRHTKRLDRIPDRALYEYRDLGCHEVPDPLGDLHHEGCSLRIDQDTSPFGSISTEFLIVRDNEYPIGSRLLRIGKPIEHFLPHVVDFAIGNPWHVAVK
jgi:hypothetical protein